ncbi:hypothetical protein KUTeg_017970 [Tegillarca granosa]|uniref:Transposase n=1 Tax=Tegillarca granosa TaxID=220873 RepID=A0ABQ9EGH4_TEGGR|nr:hypothetical protein KUTeg_017970 [Tegillarca granosa]
MSHYALKERKNAKLAVEVGVAKDRKIDVDCAREKAPKTIRKVPADYENLKSEFLRKIIDFVDEYEIPESHKLIVNFDHTSLEMIPISEWTSHEKNSKDCSIVALDDMREITVVIGISMSVPQNGHIFI